MCTGSHPFIPATNVAKVDVVQELFGETVVNSFYFRQPTPWTATTIQNLAENAADAWSGNIQAVQSVDLRTNFVRATDIGVENSYQYETPFLPDPNGDLAGESFPGNVALAVKFSTGLSGRSHRGRVYLAGIVATGRVGNTIITDYRDDLVAGVSGFISSTIGENDAEHVIVSYCQDGAWLTEAEVTPVTSYTADTNLDSQRRRLAGRGV